VSDLFHALRHWELCESKNFFTSSVKLTSVIALSPVVCHKEYFREYFGCHFAPIKRSWDIVVGVECDCYVSYISVRLILTIWKKEMFIHGKTKRHRVYLYLEI
jgi:hypothetical protein